MRVFVAGTILLLLLTLHGVAHAELNGAGSVAVDSLSTAGQQGSSTLVEDQSIMPGVAALTSAHSYLSRNVEELSRKIDAFFGTERSFDESSGTYVQARGSVIYLKHGDIDFDGNLRAKLDLPNLKRNLSLVIESESEDSLEQKGRITTGSPKVTEAFDNKNVSASLQLVLRDEPTWDIRFQPGLKLHMPPETFLRLRFRRIQLISDVWLSRAILTPGWFDPRGWEVRLRHDFDRDTGSGSLFRAASEVNWLIKEDRNIDLMQSFAFSHPLGTRARLVYEVGVTFETEPTFHETSYFSSLRYRRNIHRDWVFLELKPQILFTRDNGFKPDPSFALSIEVVFGARTLVSNRK